MKLLNARLLVGVMCGGWYSPDRFWVGCVLCLGLDGLVSMGISMTGLSLNTSWRWADRMLFIGDGQSIEI